MYAFARVALAAAIMTVPCQAADMFKKYGSAAGWDIFINDNMGPGCLIARTGNKPGDQVEIGVNATGSLQGYIALYTKRDAGVAAGQPIAVGFDIDGEKFTGQATGQQMEGFDGGVVPFNNLDFIYGLQKKKALTITAPG